MRPLNHSGARISARILGAGSVVGLSLLGAQLPAGNPLRVATAATPLPAVVIRGAKVFDGERLLAAGDVSRIRLHREAGTAPACTASSSSW